MRRKYEEKVHSLNNIIYQTQAPKENEDYITLLDSCMYKV
jgi:hypothetical protein